MAFYALKLFTSTSWRKILWWPLAGKNQEKHGKNSQPSEGCYKTLYEVDLDLIVTALVSSSCVFLTLYACDTTDATWFTTGQSAALMF